MVRVQALRAALALALLAGCGYHWGFRSPPGVRRVAVPIFDNRTQPHRREIEITLTRLVIRELQARTTWRVVSADQADAVLLGRVEDYSLSPLLEDRFDKVVEGQVSATLSLRLADARNLGRTIKGPFTVSRGVPFRLQRGENEELAREQALAELAEQVVFALEEDWGGSQADPKVRGRSERDVYDDVDAPGGAVDAPGGAVDAPDGAVDAPDGAPDAPAEGPPAPAKDGHGQTDP